MRNTKDLLSGLLLLALGIGAAAQSTQYDIGSLRDMGPGYVPLVLGIILAVTGLLIIVTSRPAIPAPRLPAEWRGWFCICASVAAFAIIGQYGGLLPATFATTFIAALGDRKNTILAAALLAAAMTVIALVVFWWLLRIQIPLFGWG